MKKWKYTMLKGGSIIYIYYNSVNRTD